MLGLYKIIIQSLKSREFRSPVEWAIFAMVANMTVESGLIVFFFQRRIVRGGFLPGL